MKMRAESLVLWGAWIAIIGAGALGARRISLIPDVYPAVPAHEARFRLQAGGASRAPTSDRSWERFQSAREWKAEGRGSPAGNWAACLVPELVGIVKERPIVDAPVLPSLSGLAGTADLDGVTLAWVLAERPARLEPHQRPVKARPAGLRIWRRENAAEWDAVALLDGKSTSWRDVGAPPGAALEYRVDLDAPEDAIRTGDAMETPVLTPAHRRVWLRGGDSKVAILTVETYNRMERKWAGRTSSARSGDELWPGGWRLGALRFRGFTLEADAVLPGGGTLKLSHYELSHKD